MAYEEIKDENVDLVLDLEANRTLVNPILDFKNDKCFIGLYLPHIEYPSMKSVEALTLIVGDEFLPTAYMEKISEKGIKLSHLPALFECRWSLESIKSFRENEPVNTRVLFNKVSSIYAKYLDFGDERLNHLISLWEIGTYLHPLFKSYPYMYIGGMKESGKTKTLHVTSLLAFNSINSGNMSASALFRLTQNNRCSLFIDETEKLTNPQRAEEFRNILLNGYKQGNKVYRTEERSGQFTVIPFETYSPKMLANIRGLEDVLESRVITVIMRKSLNAKVTEAEPEENEESQQIRDLHYHFIIQHWREIRDIYLTLENETGLKNREWELWKPILALAKFFGEELYDSMKQLAVEKAEEARTENITETAEYILVGSLLSLVKNDDFYSVKDIRATMEDKYDTAQGWLNNKWIGRALKRLGFTEKRRIGSGVEIKLTVEGVKDMATRLGIPKSEDSAVSEENVDTNTLMCFSHEDKIAVGSVVNALNREEWLGLCSHCHNIHTRTT